MMPRTPETAAQTWERLSAKRAPFVTKCERFSSMTLPKILLPDGVTLETAVFTNEHTNLGAQAVNHLSNRLMIAMFAPSRPSFRLIPTKALKQALVDAGAEEDDITPILAEAERSAARMLDTKAQRVKLYTVMKHVIVLGQVLLCLKDDKIRVIGLKYWCVKRRMDGTIHTLIMRERLLADELAEEVQPYATAATADTEVSLYTVITFKPDGSCEEDLWVDTVQLPKKFSSKYSKEDNPWHVISWDLGDESDYATGLVEEYANDFERVAALSESVSDGSILALESRNLVDQQGMTSVEDMEKSRRGDFLPGRKDDITPVTLGSFNAIAPADSILQRYEKRIAQAFLLHSAVVRDAERVTAEEIRMIAQELETSLGGVYSALASLLQAPIARWLLRQIDLPVRPQDFDLAIVTGLDALSRNGDLEALQRGLEIMSKTAMLPPDLQARIKMDKLAQKIGDGVGYDLSSVLKSQEEVQAEQQQAAAMRSAEATTTAAGEAAAQGQA
jgi:hypothetical protein